MSRQTWSTNSSEDVAVDSWRSSKQLGEGHSGATGGSDSDAEQQDHQPQQLAPVVHDSSHGHNLSRDPHSTHSPSLRVTAAGAKVSCSSTVPNLPSVQEIEPLPIGGELNEVPNSPTVAPSASVGVNKAKFLQTEEQVVPLDALQELVPNVVVKRLPGEFQERALVPLTDEKFQLINPLDQVLPPIVTRNHQPKKGSERGSNYDSTRSTRSILDSDYVTIASRHVPRRVKMQDMLERLNTVLDETGARIGGFCPTRRHVFSDMFSEIIRQVTVDMPERGLLLGRVRQEAEGSIDILKCSLHAAECLGNEKAQQIDSDTKELALQIKDLETDIRDLERQKRLLEQRQDNVYEANKAFRESRKKTLEQDQSEMKLFNSQHGNLMLVLQDYLIGKRQFNRLRDVLEDNCEDQGQKQDN
ncbi:uncharacterized protein LOC142348397 [Convolutriloba macropyga]|uniref:uncharacterized protein LOC142348397 n=1 Tax=Convolutriloba macropyga TaxID=536237 RepID=UPI003F528306